MGIDWELMKPRTDADPSGLRRLISEQAIWFQSTQGWNPVTVRDPVWGGLQYAIHSDFATASRAIRDRLNIPQWDEETGFLQDYPDLRPSWRIYPISKNRAFPPLVRCRAGRTILPEELDEQLDEWQQWAEQVARGAQDDYLRELHWYETADWSRYHRSCLHAAAAHSLKATGAWASRADVVAIRNKILRLSEPVVPEIQIAPGSGVPFELDFVDAYPMCLQYARILAELTRQWDECVRGNKKLRYYEDCYQFTLDEFRRNASDPWLHDFFQWARRGAKLGFGLFLDH